MGVPKITVGLEWHQRLRTHKLFCNCPSEVGVKPDSYETRYLRISSSELGEHDPAALLEAHRARAFQYGYSPSSACLVELDESPPHLVNEEALRIALKIALMFKMQVLDEVRVMRKVVLDGSNTSGFQRTMLIALGTDDSIIETSNGPVRLATLCLEEESAYIEKSEAREAFYRLDRLGIPLVEVATEPDIHSPEQALEVAEEVGLMLRLTGDVQRGIGTIRQDLNVSVEGGSRQEIKGVQQLELLGDIVRLEAQRQLNLLEIRNELGKRKAKTTGFNPIDVTTAFSETNSSLAKSAISNGHRIMCLLVPGFEGLLGRALQPNRRLGTELADYAQVWAGLGGIIHSDELPAYGISETEVSEIRKLCCEAKPTAFILVLGEEHRARRALTAIHDRLETALKGVPSETRKVNEDGTTSYQRPLPGSARMYPETDLPPIAIKEEMLSELKEKLPPKPSVYLKKLMSLGLTEHMANQMLRSQTLQVFEDAVKSGVEPLFAASCLLNTLPMLRREGANVDSIEDSVLIRGLSMMTEKRVPKDLLSQFIRRLAEGGDVDSSLASIYAGSVGEEEIRSVIREIVNQRIDFVRKKGKESVKPLMGIAMEKLRGKAPGSKINEILEEEVSKVA